MHFRLIALICYCALTSAVSLSSAQARSDKDPGAASVWIDLDIAIGHRLHDVDDAYALSIALHAKKYQLAGVSTIFGNFKDVKKVTPIARAMIARFSPYPVAVFEGADDAGMLGQETEASRAIEAALRRGRLRIVAGGPLTNIATVIRNHPELASRIDDVLIMGGRRLEHSAPVGPLHLRLPDANVDHDFPAIRVLFDSSVHLTLMPTEISRLVEVDAEDLDRLAQGDASAKWLASESKGWLRFFNKIVRTKGFIPFDALITSYLEDPEWFHCNENIPADIVRLRNTTYRKPWRRYKDFFTVSEALPPKRNVRYCYDLKDGYKSLFLQQLGAE